MKDLFKNLTTSSVVAFLVIIGCFAYFMLAGSGIFKAPESLQTQITQGLFGLAMAVTGYYFGASKKHDSEKGTNDDTPTDPKDPHGNGKP